MSRPKKDPVFDRFCKEAAYSVEWEKYFILSHGWRLVSDSTDELIEQYRKQEALGHTQHKLGIKPVRE